MIYIFRYILLAFNAFKGSILPIPGRVIAIIFFLVLFLFPFFAESYYINGIIIFVSIYAIYAVSWDFLSGFTGQMNLGHTAFFGIGAYSAGLLNLHLGFSPYASIPCGAFIATLGGLIVCIPALRLRGLYLALVTLAFPVVLNGVVLIFPDYSGGELGLSGLTPLADDRKSIYFIVLLVMLFSVVIMWKLSDAKSKFVRTGVMLLAIREDEITARVSGVNTVAYKIFAFAISAFFSGVAGGLYVHFINVLGPSTLDLNNSINPIVWTVFGGITTIYGPITGVFILYPLIEYFRIVPQIRMLIFAVTIIVVLLLMPEGMAVWVRDNLEEECPRCKIVNTRIRRLCRVCRAPLHLEGGLK